MSTTQHAVTTTDRPVPVPDDRCHAADDRGMVSVATCLILVVALAGATLIYDGGRALSLQRWIINVAEGAARAGVATADITGLSSPDATAAARDHVTASGVPATDIVSITATRTTVTVKLRASTTGVFTTLLGNSTLTVTGTGTAVLAYQGASP